MPYAYTITYDIVTEESAQDGDHAEHGFCQPGGWRYPIPAGLCGDAFTRWCEETGNADPVDLDVDPDDWDDFPAEREMARIMLDEGCIDNGDSLPRWWSTESSWGDPSSFAETEDGNEGLITYCYHPEGFTPEQLARIAKLMKAGNPNASL